MKKLWGIRHIRFFYLKWRVIQFAHAWGRLGIGLGFPNQKDIDHLERIWRGEA